MHSDITEGQPRFGPRESSKKSIRDPEFQRLQSIDKTETKVIHFIFVNLPLSVSISKSFKSVFNLSLDQGVAFFSVLL